MNEPTSVGAEIEPRILIITTDLCSYPGADTAGQMHYEYMANCYVMRTLTPALFPDEFYLRCLGKGVDAIILASCGTDCPYEGVYEKLAARVDRVYARMKEQGIDTRRLRLTAICTVCTKAFVREIEQMNEVLAEIGPVTTSPTAAEGGAQVGS